MIVWDTMDVGINNVIYMELHLGPKMANGTCRKMIIAGTIDRDSTVLIFFIPIIQHLPVTWGFPVSVVTGLRVWREGDCGGRDVIMACWVTGDIALATELTAVEAAGDWTGVILSEEPKLNTGDT